MNLTEFLLARIAEDKAWANSHRAPDCDDCGADFVRRVAECEAKRRIAEKHFPTEFDREDGGYGGGGVGCLTDIFDTDDDGNCETLKLLALPYLDHPDYDEAWRP